MSESTTPVEQSPPKITRRRKRAAEEFFLGATKAEAYRRAFAVKEGWDARRVADNAYRVFKHPEVKAYLAYLAKEAEEHYEIRKHLVVTKLIAAATANAQDLYDEKGELIPIHRLPREIAATISSVEVEEQYDGQGENRKFVGVLRKVKQIDSNRSAEVLGKMQGWIKDKMELDLKNAAAPVIHVSVYEDDDEVERAARAAISRQPTST